MLHLEFWEIDPNNIPGRATPKIDIYVPINPLAPNYPQKAQESLILDQKSIWISNQDSLFS